MRMIRLFNNAVTIPAIAVSMIAVMLLATGCSDDDNDNGGGAPFIIIEKERWGLVDNAYSKEAGVSNTEALNLAMNFFADSIGGYARLRLERGDYCVWGANADGYSNYVNVPSNVELDLNGSTLRLAKNDQTSSRVMRVYKAENVKISNGTIIGARDDHDYGNTQGPRGTFGQSREWASHEYGVGIWVADSKNVTLRDLTIKAVTGDCVYIGYKSANVTVSGCDVSRARRGGIVLTSSDGVVIRGNRIYDVYNDRVHLDESGNVISIGEEACIAFEAFNTAEWITNTLIENNTIIGTDGDFTDNDGYGDGSSSRLHWTVSISWGTSGVTIRNNDMTGGFRIATGSNILFEKNTLKNKRAQDASGYGRFMATYPVNADAYDGWRNSENVMIRNNKFYDITLMINGGTLRDDRPNYRKNYAVVGNEFTMISNWRAPVHINSTVNTAVFDNKFSVDEENWLDSWYNPTVARRPEAYCFISINASTQPLHDVAHNFYIANNSVDKNTAYKYMKVYWLPDHYDHDREGYGLEDGVSPTHEGLPDWYKESNSRTQAMAWVDSWKWY